MFGKSEASVSGGGDASGVKVYRALVTQTGEDPPVSLILENSLGGVPVWTRQFGGGQYFLTLVGAFPANKTFVRSSVEGVGMNPFFFFTERYSDDVIQVQTFLPSEGGQVEFGSQGNFLSLEILVYP